MDTPDEAPNFEVENSVIDGECCWPWQEAELYEPFVSGGDEGISWINFSNPEVLTPSLEGPLPQGTLDDEVARSSSMAHRARDPETALFTDLAHSTPVSPQVVISRNELNQNSRSNWLSLEEMRIFFHQYAVQVLSMSERSENPWSTVVWPMACQSEALFHALAAIACFQQVRNVPFMHEQGLAHIQESLQDFIKEQNDEDTGHDVLIATALALSIATSWNSQKPSIDYDHIQTAKRLIHQSIITCKTSPCFREISYQMRFLSRAWLHRDVLARFTCSSNPVLDLELFSFIANSSNLGPTSEELDPLMGYSTTLFPTLGRVANLVSEIRTRFTRRNSPVIISKAIELRHTIEDWAPAVDLEKVDDPTPIMTDAIQTAEAYRWATLLLLQQAVPELPSLVSYKELGQRVLVYLATVPNASLTILIHTYPLMIAATEAVEEEDREFVRDRWKSLSERITTGIIDRCIEITEEVWYRRDLHLAEWLSRNGPEAMGFRDSLKSV